MKAITKWPQSFVKRIVLTFSGQNSQFKGMFQPFQDHPFFDRFLNAQQVQSILFPSMNKDYYSTCTSYAQPAILLHSVMLLSYLNHRLTEAATSNKRLLFASRDQETPHLLSMGHSLGEYSALCASNCDTESLLVKHVDKAMELVHQRGLFIRQVIEEQETLVPEKQFGMSALLFTIDLTEDQMTYIMDFVRMESTKHSLVCDVANINSNRQLVLSGWKQDVSHIANLLSTELNATYSIKTRVFPLQNVAAPFHCRLLTPVADKLGDLLNRTYAEEMEQNKQLHIPIVSNTSASVMTHVADLVHTLPEQVYKPVLWRQSLLTAYNYMNTQKQSLEDEEDPILFIEISPKPTLTPFTSSVLGNHSGIRTLCITQPNDVDHLFD